MPSIPSKSLPGHVRRCYEAYKKANQRNRDAEIERLKFYAGDQWRETEVTKRKGQDRPYITINKCKPAVDQIEGDIRLNPPGPKCKPVGGGADKDTADILEGLLREVDYRSNSKTAYATAGKYVAASGCAYIELATEYVGEREFAQQLTILSIEDPSTVFFDPTATRANREDAGWAGKLKMYGKTEYIAAFGDKRRVLQPKGIQAVAGWIQDAIGYDGSLAKVNEWTGNGEGPFYVAEFYMVEIEQKTLRLYTDEVARYDDEFAPRGVKPKPGEEYTRQVPKRTIKKYVVDALEVLDETEWLGSLIPLFPVLGPEIYIDGKLHRLSLISGAIDSNRALNYVATTATELAGMLPKSPWLGPKGSFDDPRWASANSEMWSYLEYTPVFVANEMGQQVLAPEPKRNQWEAPIQWLLALGAYFSDSIKAVTGIFDPSLGAQKGDQSGKAIEQLRSESNVGNFSYADNLHRTIEIIYNQEIEIFPKIMDGARVVTIVRPDTQHETIKINQKFDSGQGKMKAHHIGLGRYAARVTVDRDFDERQSEAVASLVEFFKIAPQALAIPGVAAQFLRLVGEGNPQIEHMADLLAPDQDGEVTPEQLQTKLQQTGQENQALKQLVQRLAQEKMAKLPEIEAKKWQTLVESLTKIHIAKVTASKDADHQDADREASAIEQLLGMAHEAATQAQDHEHQKGLAAHQAAQAAATQGAEHKHQQTMQENEPEPVGAEQ